MGSALRGNPRQIKRFLNILALRRRLAKANKLGIHLQLLIKLAVLEYAWKDVAAGICVRDWAGIEHEVFSRH